MTRRAQARLLLGGPIAAEIRAGVAADVVALSAEVGHVPALAVVLMGGDPASSVYLHQILRSCRSVGIEGRVVEVPGDAAPGRLVREIEALNADPTVAGIIVQMPLPPLVGIRTITDVLDPVKDIDGIHPVNVGLLALGYECVPPATAEASVEILRRSGVELAGKRVVVVGRSNVIGKPVVQLLIREHATVTICHSRTVDLRHHVHDAEIVIAAAGRPGLITGEMLRVGAVVVDVGINMVGDRIVGDVDFESARLVASAITPVPGGVGPVTSALLLTHVVRAARVITARSATARVPADTLTPSAV